MNRGASDCRTYEAVQGRVMLELSEATGAITNERRMRHMPFEQRNFYYATVASSASSGQAYEGSLSKGNSTLRLTRFGERTLMNRCLKQLSNLTNSYWPVTSYDVIKDETRKYKGAPRETVSLSSSSGTVLSVCSYFDLVRENSFDNMSDKRFRKCADPCPRFLTPGDIQDLCVFCLGEEHARTVLEGAVCVNCERLPMRTLCSRLALFSRGEEPASAPGPARAEAEWRFKSWGSQTELAEELERGVNLSQPTAADEGELLNDDDVLSLTSSDPAASALLAASPREQEMAFEEEASEPAETSEHPCPVYAELLEVMEHASGRLQLPWDRVRKEVTRGRLDERFLSGHNKAAPVSLPFLPDLHVEIEKAWKNPYSARIHLHQRANFADVEGLSQHGYVSMPPIDETFANYLVTGQAPTLKAPVLPSKPLKVTSRLNGRAYAAAGRAVFQANKADLLKDLDQGQGLSHEAVEEPRRTTDLALRATKQTAASIVAGQ
ncbi:hypothetical protein DPX16_20122 [Anabarilius grahami]|uniref:Uncharacterized protein n=1 Tax=Anabarilius grahami TaxID=495550 RepID=A0A3N0XQT7_ANAGA|nr:hypothetical protein DPX16_20122 [Anabarilius grahami]